MLAAMRSLTGIKGNRRNLRQTQQFDHAFAPSWRDTRRL
jgi:hypothetical protein